MNISNPKAESAAIVNIADISSGNTIDLRSDTVTKPTSAMYSRMAAAPLGDDGLDGDPTVIELEILAAEALGKEASLFVASCTMANLLATLIHAERNAQVLVEAQAHMYMSERGAATFTGAFYAPIPGTLGAMDLDLLRAALEGSGSKLRTSMIALETSHNNAAGAVLPLDHMAAVKKLATGGNVSVHLDGARLFNAAVHLGVAPSHIAEYADSVSLCLSKGLSAPVGAILAGSHTAMARARKLRKMIGGQQRQAGIVAAAGIEAVLVMGTRLGEDHARAKRLSDLLNGVHPQLTATIPQTNILQVDIAATGKTASEWVAALAAQGLLVRPWANKRLRCVTHRHITDEDIQRAYEAFRAVSADLNNSCP